MKLIKHINIYKVMGEDEIPQKLIKSAGNFLVEPLRDIINSCFSASTFPDLAKRASITAIDKMVLISILTHITDPLVF